ncbi:MAG TPA: adenosylcobinamide-GDP ribazoletransferase [Candidatus Aquabacterium excrementipullorum]|nr:adenosylcobinamide-GDP ribazoletransferase [Candidatus Aquabacterium excrementipullorum]
MLRSIVSRLILELRLFFTALQFFTRVPVPAWVGYQPEWLQACARHFPLVGAVVGVAGALVLAIASLWWPPLVAVLLSMAFTVWMTGGFHEDGWADTCDGLGGTVDRERALTIMKDSRLGSYGALGLALMLGLKAAVLTSLLAPVLGELNDAESSHVHQVLLGWTLMALLWSHTTSRLAPVLVIRALPYAGDVAHAKAKPLATQVSWGGVLGAVLGWAVVSVALVAWVDHIGWPVPTLLHAMGWASLAVALGTGWVARWLRRRLGGYTGDTLGAAQQITEVLSLLAWLAVVHPVTWVRW